MKRILFGIAAVVLLPMSDPVIAHAQDYCVAAGGTPAQVQACERGRQMQIAAGQNPDLAVPGAPAAPAPQGPGQSPRGPGACGLDSCPDLPNQPTHGEGICQLTGACTAP